MHLERAHPAFLTTLVVLVFVPDELKRPKNNMSFFVFIHILGVGEGSDIFFIFFETFPNPLVKKLIGKVKVGSNLFK